MQLFGSDPNEIDAIKQSAPWRPAKSKGPVGTRARSKASVLSTVFRSRNLSDQNFVMLMSWSPSSLNFMKKKKAKQTRATSKRTPPRTRFVLSGGVYRY